jgi:hypothetical protein
MTDLVCQYSFFYRRLRLHLHLYFTFLVFILYLHCCVFCYRGTVLHTLVLHQLISPLIIPTSTIAHHSFVLNR